MCMAKVGKFVAIPKGSASSLDECVTKSSRWGELC